MNTKIIFDDISITYFLDTEEEIPEINSEYLNEIEISAYDGNFNINIYQTLNNGSSIHVYAHTIAPKSWVENIKSIIELIYEHIKTNDSIVRVYTFRFDTCGNLVEG